MADVIKPPGRCASEGTIGFWHVIPTVSLSAMPCIWKKAWLWLQASYPIIPPCQIKILEYCTSKQQAPVTGTQSAVGIPSHRNIPCAYKAESHQLIWALSQRGATKCCCGWEPGSADTPSLGGATCAQTARNPISSGPQLHLTFSQ